MGMKSMTLKKIPIILCLAAILVFPATAGFGEDLSSEESRFIDLVNDARATYCTSAFTASTALEYKDGAYDAAVRKNIRTRIYFLNYIDADTGVTILFDNLLDAEIAAAYSSEKILLSDAVSYIDPDFTSGVDAETGMNYYQIDTTLMSDISALEMGFVTLVNQARNDPLNVMNTAGLNDRLSEFMYNRLSESTGGMPVLFLNSALVDSAQLHAGDMLDSGYISTVSLDGATALDRSIARGYDPVTVTAEAGLSYACTCASWEDGIYNIFKSFFKTQLGAAAADDLTLLSDTVSDIGTGAADGYSDDLGNICGDYVLVLETDMGESASAPAAYGGGGIVYTDLNGDGIYQPGEGIEDADIVVTNSFGSTLDIVSTDTTGAWFFKTGSPPLFSGFEFALRDGQELGDDVQFTVFEPRE